MSVESKFKPISPRSRERGPVEARKRCSVVRRSLNTLHAHVSVAPLKRRSGRFAQLGVDLLSPRSRERGPVEAVRFVFSWLGKFFSPRSRERGPVEARSVRAR